MTRKRFFLYFTQYSNLYVVSQVSYYVTDVLVLNTQYLPLQHRNDGNKSHLITTLEGSD